MTAIGAQNGKQAVFVGNYFRTSQTYGSVGRTVITQLRARGWEVLVTSAVANKALRLLDMLWSVVRWRARYDVAQVDVFSGPAFLWSSSVCAVLRALGKPYVLTLHGGNLPAFAAKHPERVRRTLRPAAAVTSPSEYLRANLREYRDDIRIVPNIVNLGEHPFRVRETPAPRFVWVRAFHAIYNPTLVPRIVARLLSVVPGLHVDMIGPDKHDGSLEATRAACASLGVADQITFVGAVPSDTVPGWLDKNDIFLNTTFVDNTPVSVMQALACGLPVVSTNVGGIPYALSHDVDALLVPPDDEEAMVREIRRILGEPGLAGRLSRSGRERVAQCDPSVVGPQWEEILTAAVEGVRTQVGANGQGGRHG